MDFDTIEYREIEHIGWISIKERPGDQYKADCLGYEVSDACSALSSKDSIWVVIFSGAENISLLLSGGENANIPKESLSGALAGIEKPVMAGIKGDVIGLGLEAILACDIRVASENSHFGLNHLEYGLIPYDGGTQRLSRLVGKGKALEMILTGEVIDAREAHRIGLINRIVKGPDPNEVLVNLAHEMALKSPIALNYAKETVNSGMDLTLEQGLRLEADLYMLIHTTSDRTEGIRAFQEKRTPRFKGE